MSKLEYFGQFNREDPDFGHLYLLEIPSASLLSRQIELLSKYFICFIVSNSIQDSDEVLSQVARKLLFNGAVGFCTFGDDCERFHDLIDEQVRVMKLENGSDETIILTSWHDSQPFEDALWYFLYTTIPSEAYAAECKCWVLVSIGNHAFKTEIRKAFQDPENFKKTVLSKMPDDEES
jgi:hypothetical protein